MKDMCQCDVGDKELLALFRTKRNSWKEQLAGKTDLSIQGQMELMLWDDRVFYTFHKAYGECEKGARTLWKRRAPSEGVPISMVNLWERSYVEKQHMAIRRLVDRDCSGRVVSLFALLDNIQNHKHLFTRENYVCYDGLPYDQNSASTDKAAAEIAGRHDIYDQISGKSSSNRSRLDPVDDAYFKKTKDKCGAFERVRNVTNRFIAHAAPPRGYNSDSRYADIEDTLREFDKCYKGLMGVAKRISILVDEVITPVSCSDFRQFDGVDIPILTRDDHRRLDSYWDSREELIQKWLDDPIRP